MKRIKDFLIGMLIAFYIGVFILCILGGTFIIRYNLNDWTAILFGSVIIILCSNFLYLALKSPERT